MVAKKNFVLKWDLDSSSQDGYLHTRSFPLSLGEETEFKDIKEKRIPIAIVLENFSKNAIVAVPREKYPGELNSITKGSINESILNQAVQQHKFLNDCEIVGFSHLYKKLLNAVKDSDQSSIEIRKGITMQLFSTEEPYVYVMQVLDRGLDSWRPYRKLIDNPLDKREIDKSEEIEIRSALKLDPRELFNRANKKRNPSKRKVVSLQYQRSPYVVAFVLKRSKGKCELCERDAPFIKDNGEMYLEVHHLKSLSKGGTDLLENAAALCPNCHRKLHYAKERNQEASKLLNNLKSN